jgi:thioredoxin-related protein
MKTRFFALLVMSLFLGIISTQAVDKATKSRVFSANNYKAVLKAAKSDNKPVMIYVSAKYCFESNVKVAEMMEQEKVANYLNKNFVCKQVDASNLWYQGKLRSWGVTNIPSFVYLSSDGKLLDVTDEVKNMDDLISSSAKALELTKQRDQNFREIK